MADPKSAALPLGDAPTVSVRPKYRVAPGFLNKQRAGARRPVHVKTPNPTLNTSGGGELLLVRHRGANRVPHATDLLAHQGQRADHGDADEDQDEPVLGVGLTRLTIHHDHLLPS